ncbi:MAG TPA: M56 family metallopeptidase [Gemmatimonadaceae bacterium]|nr:M56 family metallopeptidase [Gemmatimonadaceae bacterium]
MIAFMMYAVLVGGLAVVAGRAAEWLFRAMRWPVRWVWAGALLTVVLLAAAAPMRRPRASYVVGAVNFKFPSDRPVAMSAAQEGLVERLANVRYVMERAVIAPVERGLLAVRAHSSTQANMAAGIAAVVLSLGAFIVMLAVERRFRAARRNWPAHAIAGVPVRVSPTLGPVVIGVTRPEIVVPAWLLERADAEQRLAVAHEREHVRAGDPLLLRAAGAAAALLPWNPAVWYAYTRLRLAIELDCDARLLRGGAPARSYGTLLIDMAERAAPLRLAALALADDSSHLYQRILAMKSSRPRFVYGRALVAAAVAVTAILAACESTMPTQADVQSMDAASAERALVALKAAQDSTRVAYTVDGRTVTANEARKLRADTLTSIVFMRGTNGRMDTLKLRTYGKAGVDSAATLEVKLAREATLNRRVDGEAGTGLLRLRIRDSTALIPSLSNRAAETKAAILIDGVMASAAQMRSLNPDDIASIEVVKGASARRAYSYILNADKGVISIVTKSGKK